MDSPLPLVKEEKNRPMVTTSGITPIVSHSEYPAISGLLSFIKPEPMNYHSKNSSDSSLVQSDHHNHHRSIDVPLSLSTKNLAQNNTSVASSSVLSLGAMPTHLSRIDQFDHHHRMDVPLSLSVKNMAQNSISMATSSQLSSGTVPSVLSRPHPAASLHHQSPSAVPVSVVTSVSDYQKTYHKLKNANMNTTAHRTKNNNENNNNNGEFFFILFHFCCIINLSLQVLQRNSLWHLCSQVIRQSLFSVLCVANTWLLKTYTSSICDRILVKSRSLAPCVAIAFRKRPL